jgi:hypothetical protein
VKAQLSQRNHYPQYRKIDDKSIRDSRTSQCATQFIRFHRVCFIKFSSLKLIQYAPEWTGHVL